MAFVISDGALASVDRRPRPALPATVRMSDSIVLDAAAIWRSQPQVRTVVGFLARNIAQLGVHVYRRVSDLDRRREHDHPVSALISQPNPWTTTYRWVEQLVADLAIYDNSLHLKVSVAGQTKALVRVRPEQVELRGDNPFHPEYYRVRGSRGFRDFAPDEVLHLRGFNPGDSRWGESPLVTLRQILLEEWEGGRYREQLWRTSARTSGYIERPLDAPEWSSTDKQRFREQWQEQYTGGGAQAGGTPILEDGMKFVGAATTPRDAQWIEGRKLTREEVAAAYFIPPPMVGILDNANYSNVSEFHKGLYQDCLGPPLTMMPQEFALQLLPDFPDTRDLYIEFNLAEKLRGSFEEQANQLQTAVGGPFMTRNEGRARLNLPQVDGGDELITPLNVIIGGQASPTDSAPPPTASGAAARPPRVKRIVAAGKARPDGAADRAQQVFAGFFERQGQVVASLVGAAKSARRKSGVDDVFDLDRWNVELAAELYPLDLAISSTAARAALADADEDSGAFDEEATRAWHLAAADGIAAAMNTVTAARLAGELDNDDPPAAVRDLFATYVTARAAQLAVSHVTAMAGFGTTEAARQTGRAASKTWRVRSSKPRKEHARIDGETVGIDEPFSNGAQWPGDSRLDEDQRAGCRCDVEISFE